MEQKRFWEDRVIGITGLVSFIGVLCFFSLRIGQEESWEKFQAYTYSRCTPRVVRGIDTLSPVELRRLANARERMEKVK